MTAGDIRNDLKALIGPGNIATDDQLLVWINEAYQYMCDEINKTNPDYFTVSSLTNLTANQFEYWMPPDCEKIIRVEANWSGTWRRLTALQDMGQVAVSQNIANNTGPIVFTEINPAYYTVGGKIGVLPMPLTTVTNGLKLWYVQQPSDLAAGDTPLFGARYHKLIKLGAYANYLDLDDQHQQAEIKLNRFEQRVQAMCEGIADRQEDMPKSIEIVQDATLYVDTLYTDGIV